jgi:putative heme transporter
MGATTLPLIRSGRTREEAGSETYGGAPRQTVMPAAIDTPPELALPALDVRALARRAAVPAALVAVVAAGLIVAGGPLQTFADALGRALRADPRWVGAGAAFELLSFGGYIALLWLVGTRSTSRLDLRASAQITLSGAAATRMLPTGGAGGAALTLWALRRSGLGARGATRTLLAFLVLLYAVFLGSIAVAGGAIALGLAHADGPLALSAGPAAFATAAIVAGLVLAARPGPAGAPVAGVPAGAPRAARVRAAIRNTPGTLGGAIGDAIGLLRRGDARLLGAPAWWAFDAAVLWAMLHAFGAPPALAVVVLGYFVGQVANTIPIPGAVSGGMVGVLLAFGVEPDLALTSVLAYRAIAIWLPTPIGLAAIGGLRRTIARWGAEDAPAETDDAPEAPTRVRVPGPRHPLRRPEPAIELAA